MDCVTHCKPYRAKIDFINRPLMKYQAYIRHQQCPTWEQTSTWHDIMTSSEIELALVAISQANQLNDSIR